MDVLADEYRVMREILEFFAPRDFLIVCNSYSINKIFHLLLSIWDKYQLHAVMRILQVHGLGNLFACRYHQRSTVDFLADLLKAIRTFCTLYIFMVIGTLKVFVKSFLSM